MLADHTSTDGRPSLRVRDGVAWIVLNRPERHNRLEPADVALLSSMFQDLASRPGMRVVALTARGPTFSSGFDLETLAGDGAHEGAARFAAMCDLFEALPMPTICGLNGNAYGGGSDLAVAADFRLGVDGCRVQLSPARLGIQFYHSGLRRFVERLGLDEAKRLFLTGEQIDAATMAGGGFLHEVCAPSDLDERMTALAGILSERSPASLRGLKASLNAIAGGTDGPAEVDGRFFDSLRSPDAREGLLALSERRPPKFADT